MLQTQVGVAEATLLHNQAALAQAKLSLGYTTVTSPVAGAVGNRSVELGQYVQPGAQLLPMGRDIYVVANFKETQLKKMRIGQPVTIDVDAYPKRPFRAKVQSIAAATGAKFALLPPDNATGNFTKVVQRIPVKIVLDGHNSELRPGMSVIPSIQTRAPAAVAAQPARPRPATSRGPP